MARNKFDVDEELESEFNLKHLKRLFTYIKPYRKTMLVTVLLMVLSNMATLLGPYLVKIAMDDKIPAGDVKGLIELAIIFLLSLVVIALCMKYRIRTMNRVGQNILVTLRRDLFTHLQKLPFTFYDSRPHGKILVRVVNYVNSLSDILSNGLVNLVTDLVSLFIALGFMLIINPKLTMVCMIGVPILLIIVILLKNAQRKAFQLLSSKQSNMNAYIHESIAGIRITQSFAREEENLKIFRDVCNQYRTSWLNAVKIQFLLWPTVENVSTITASMVYGYGIFVLGVGVNQGVTVGVLIAFIAYLWRFWNPIITICNFYNALINAVAYLERIFETMDIEPEIVDAKDAYELPIVKGKVDFNDVLFRYEDDKEILKGINFSVNPGDSIALVGPTGAGKTTIISLLSRFYDVSAGEILIDGHDISKVTLNSLRTQMGVMLQDTFIFAGTIMDNIRYGKLDATDEEVIEAAKAVRAHDFIIELKDGYNTEVNERGSRLSAGQRQLISFARALLADPRILILDEATSSIDTKTELALQEGLQRLLKGRTSFIIAHRLSTIKNSTKIMYVNDGVIAEAGNHDELMEQQGYYYHLYNSQFAVLKAV